MEIWIIESRSNGSMGFLNHSDHLDHARSNDAVKRREQLLFVMDDMILRQTSVAKSHRRHQAILRLRRITRPRLIQIEEHS